MCVCIFVYIYLYSLLYIEKEREPYPSYTLFQTSVTALFQTVCGKSRLLSSPLDSAPSNRLSTFRRLPTSTSVRLVSSWSGPAWWVTEQTPKDQRRKPKSLERWLFGCFFECSVSFSESQSAAFLVWN